MQAGAQDWSGLLAIEGEGTQEEGQVAFTSPAARPSRKRWVSVVAGSLAALGVVLCLRRALMRGPEHAPKETALNNLASLAGTAGAGQTGAVQLAPPFHIENAWSMSTASSPVHSETTPNMSTASSTVHNETASNMSTASSTVHNETAPSMTTASSPPASDPQAPALIDVGVNPSTQLGECHGDCDSDSDCENGLRCFQRDSQERVPGCSGGTDEWDYCWHPTKASVPGYDLIEAGCVDLHNMAVYPGKSVESCAALCDAEPRCLAFEFFVDYGGTREQGPWQPEDCLLNDGCPTGGCNGAPFNSDLYVKQGPTFFGRAASTLAAVYGFFQWLFGTEQCSGIEPTHHYPLSADKDITHLDYTEGLPSPLVAYPKDMTACDVARLQQDCLEQINAFRVGGVPFSDGRMSAHEPKDPFELAPEDYSKCMNEKAASDLLYSDHRGAGCGHYTSGQSCGFGLFIQAENSCCTRGCSNYDECKETLIGCLVGMYNEGQRVLDTGNDDWATAGHYWNMVGGGNARVACGFGFDSDGRVVMTQSFGPLTEPSVDYCPSEAQRGQPFFWSAFLLVSLSFSA